MRPGELLIDSGDLPTVVADRYDRYAVNGNGRPDEV